ncbi:hypothetical protein HZS_4544 [Henneguya salminicola]|nr:hypothetical protein HZS_4544 [Henneguya salminicola]
MSFFNNNDSFPQERLNCAYQLVKIIFRSANNDLILPNFVLNALFYLIAKLFIILYPKIWTDFFSNLKWILAGKPKGIEYYFRIADYINTEIQSNYTLLTYDLNLVEISDVELIKLALDVYSNYINWNDLSFSFTHRSLEFVFIRLYTTLINTSVVKLIDKAGCIEIDRALRYVKENMISLLNECIALIQKILEFSLMCFSIFDNESEDIYCFILPFLSKYVSYSNDAETISFIIEITFKKCYFYSKLTRDDDSVVCEYRQNFKTLLFNLSKNLGILFTSKLFEHIYNSIFNMKHDLNIDYILSFLILLKDLPGICSLSHVNIKLCCDIILKILYLIFDVKIVEIPHSNHKINIFKILQLYCFAYCDKSSFLDIVLIYLISTHGVESSLEDIQEKAAETILKIIQYPSPNIYGYYPPIFNFFYRFIDSIIGNQRCLQSQNFGPLVLEILSFLTSHEFSKNFINDHDLCSIIERLKQSLTIAINDLSVRVDCSTLGKNLNDTHLIELIYLIKCLNSFSKGIRLKKSSTDSEILFNFHNQIPCCFMDVIKKFPFCDELVSISFTGLKQCFVVSSEQIFQNISQLIYFYKAIPNAKHTEFMLYLYEISQKTKIIEDFILPQTINIIVDFICFHIHYISHHSGIYSNDNERLIVRRTIMLLFKQYLSYKDILTSLINNIHILEKIILFTADQLKSDAEESSVKNGLICISIIIDKFSTISKNNQSLCQIFNQDFYQKYFIFPTLYVVVNYLKIKSNIVIPKLSTNICCILLSVIKMNYVHLIFPIWQNLKPDLGSVPLIEFFRENTQMESSTISQNKDVLMSKLNESLVVILFHS